MYIVWDMRKRWRKHNLTFHTPLWLVSHIHTIFTNTCDHRHLPNNPLRIFNIMHIPDLIVKLSHHFRPTKKRRRLRSKSHFYYQFCKYNEFVVFCPKKRIEIDYIILSIEFLSYVRRKLYLMDDDKAMKKRGFRESSKHSHNGSRMIKLIEQKLEIMRD